MKPNPKKAKIEYHCSQPSLLRHCISEKNCKTHDAFDSITNSTAVTCQVGEII